MKPCYYSEKDAEMNNLGWRRMGADICYYKTNLNYYTGKSEKPYYALTFTVTFTHDNDTVYLAHCYPYTYTDLQVSLFAMLTCTVIITSYSETYYTRTLSHYTVFQEMTTPPEMLNAKLL